MQKNIDIFGWKYRPSQKEMQLIQGIIVFTMMCLIILKGLTSILTLRFCGLSILGCVAYFAKTFIS